MHTWVSIGNKQTSVKTDVINKLWYIHILEYHTALKISEQVLYCYTYLYVCNIHIMYYKTCINMNSSKNNTEQ